MSDKHRGRANFPVFMSLEQEWGYLARTPEVRACQREWWAAEPALKGFAAGDVVERVKWEGHQTSEEGASLLSALLRLAACRSASRCLLQVLLPRLAAENVYTPTFGHGVGEGFRRPADTAADLVAECFAAIWRHAGEDHSGHDIGRLLVGEATRRLRTARQAERRHQLRTVTLDAHKARQLSTGLFGARSRAEWLASAVVEARREGLLSPEQAALLYATRVQGLPASEVGRRQRLAPRAVYHALFRAEHALLSRAA
jgi:DNA-directed RNA polymerase specialized sigma24 family protein